MRILALVGQAYDAIGIDDLAVQLSLTPSDTLQGLDNKSKKVVSFF